MTLYLGFSFLGGPSSVGAGDGALRIASVPSVLAFGASDFQPYYGNNEEPTGEVGADPGDGEVIVVPTDPLPDPVYIQYLVVKVTGAAGNSGKKLKAAIYASDGVGGKPLTRVAVGDEITLTAPDLDGDVKLTFSVPVLLDRGVWYIGVHTDGTVEFYGSDGTSIATDDTYQDGTSGSFGEEKSKDKKLKVSTPVSTAEPTPVELEAVGTPVTTGFANSAYGGFTVGATGGVMPYAFSKVSGILGTVDIDPVTGFVSGTLPDAGLYENILFRVTDAKGATADLPLFSVVVSEVLDVWFEGQPFPVPANDTTGLVFWHNGQPYAVSR